jgi:hypothetical protein
MVSKYNQNPNTGPAVQHNNIELLTNNDNNTIISNPNTQKLYKRTGDNQLKRGLLFTRDQQSVLDKKEEGKQ